MKKSELLARIVELEKQVAQLKLQQDIDRASRPVYVPPLGYTPTWPGTSPVTCEPIDWRLKGYSTCTSANPDASYTMTKSRPVGQYLSVTMSSNLTPNQRKNLEFNERIGKWRNN